MRRSGTGLCAGLLLAVGCGGGNVTLNFTFMGDSNCDDVGIDSVSYTVTQGADVTDAGVDAGMGPVVTSGNVTCGYPASFGASAGTYTVAANAISDGSSVYTTSQTIEVTKGNDDFTIDFPHSSE